MVDLLVFPMADPMVSLEVDEMETMMDLSMVSKMVVWMVSI